MGHADRSEPIEPVGYGAAWEQVPGCDALTLAELRTRAVPATFVGPQRPAFHLFMAVESGEGRHTIDFEDVALRRGVVLWVRAGQVHEWGDLTGYEAFLLIVEPGYLEADPAAADAVAGARGATVVDGRNATALAARIGEVHRLAHEPDALPVAVRAGLVRLLVAATAVELVARSGAGAPAPSASPVVDLLLADVERHFRSDHDVTTYAARLGWSTRTLARATRAATGRSPKQLLDERLVLEARRLLAHSDLGVGQVAHQLGFGGASRFSAWFRHHTGTTPSAWREAQREGRRPSTGQGSGLGGGA